MNWRIDTENGWINDVLWPNFTRFIHGDLYAGHVLTHTSGKVSGIIDWSNMPSPHPWRMAILLLKYRMKII